ncbi:WG repeat-containing protein [Kovacikia minuta CCNUW1]|uniref:WG repeat-containing protein n=1 Tax=Kovacikia minuta TaxID=2931930 RepID=UPI001CCA275B|nr:WG repeat-containing protein [Kovacikia minuta]UBF26030.1 WG repeat-containing protein [Kovacikia minuta CCNUW1]
MKRTFLMGMAIVLCNGIFALSLPILSLADESNPKQTDQAKSQPEMIYAGDFSEGLAAVKIGEKYGYIDRTGNLIIQPKFDYAGSFSEGLAVVGKEGEPEKWGYIDKAGKLAIPFKFDEAGKFFEGLAQIRVGKDYRSTTYINKFGEIVLRIEKEVFGFSEGIARVCEPPKYPKAPCQYSYIDKSGASVFSPQVDAFGRFSEGLAEARGKNGGIGYIDKTGKFIVQPKFLRTDSFSEGLAKAAISVEQVCQRGGGLCMNQEKWGYIDKTGEFVIKPQFFEAEKFSNGLARVRVNGRWGYIDKTGTFVIPPQFDQAQDFSEGLAFVLQEPDCPGNSVDHKTNKEGFIDQTGKVVIPVKYDREMDIRWAFGCNPDFTEPPKTEVSKSPFF